MIGVGQHVPVVFANKTMTVTTSGEGTVVYESYEPHKVTPAELDELSGDYHSPELDAKFKLTAKGKRLVVHAPNRRISLRAVVPDMFARSQARVLLLVERNDSGAITGFRLDAGNMRGFVIKRKSD